MAIPAATGSREIPTANSTLLAASGRRSPSRISGSRAPA
jgi:hypothetical protein